MSLTTSSTIKTPDQAPEPSNPDKRLHIQQAAKQRFLHYGLNKTTMRDIASDLGISVSNLYLYYKNKNDMVVDIAFSCRAEQEELLTAILATEEILAPEKLKRFLIEKFRCKKEFHQHAAHAQEIMACLLQQNPQIQDEWHQCFENSISEILKQGQSQGLFRIKDIPNTATMLRLATSAFFLPDFVSQTNAPQEQELGALVDWLTKKLEAR